MSPSGDSLLCVQLASSLPAFHFSDRTNFVYLLLHLCFLCFNWFICSTVKQGRLTGLCWHKQALLLRQFTFSFCIFMVNLSVFTESQIVSIRSITVQVCGQTTVFERNCLYMPAQFDDWWGKYLREGQSMKGVLLLSVWNGSVVIKEVAQCHILPQAVFFLPGTGKSNWATSRTSRAWLRLHCHSLFLTLRSLHPLWASQGPSNPLHRITL